MKPQGKLPVNCFLLDNILLIQTNRLSTSFPTVRISLVLDPKLQKEIAIIYKY